jgi:hypothetical protein
MERGGGVGGLVTLPSGMARGAGHVFRGGEREKREPEQLAELIIMMITLCARARA